MNAVIADEVKMTLATGCDSTTTVITVVSSASMPSLAGDLYTFLVLTEGASREVVKATAVTSNTITVVRGQGGTTGTAFNSGAKCELRVSAAIIESMFVESSKTITSTALAALTTTEIGVLSQTQLGALVAVGATAGANGTIGMPKAAVAGQETYFYNGAGNYVSHIAGMTYRDVWDTSATYSVDDIVHFGGALYVCKLAADASIADPATATTYWGVAVDASTSGNLTNSQIQNITTTQMQLLTTTQLGGLTPTQVGGILGLGGPSTVGGVVFGGADGKLTQHATALNIDASTGYVTVGALPTGNVFSVRLVAQGLSETKVANADMSSMTSSDVIGPSLSALTDGELVFGGWSTNYLVPVCTYGIMFYTIKNISKIRFYVGSNGGNSYPKNFTVERYINGSWSKVSIMGWVGATQYQVDKAQGFNSVSSSGWNEVSFTPINGLGFRINQSSTWNNSGFGPNSYVYEMEMYEYPAAPNPLVLDLTPDGNGGINTATPAAKWDINNTSNSLSLRVLRSGIVPTDLIASFHSDIGGAGTKVCEIRNNGAIYNNGTYGTLSDSKEKSNITDASPKLADMMLIKLYNFTLKREPAYQHFGFIAQQVAEVFPALVEDIPDIEMVPDPNWIPGDNQTEANRPFIQHDLGTVTKYVKASVFVPMLVKAVQELHQKVLDLNELQSNSQTLQTLAARMTALETQLGG